MTDEDDTMADIDHTHPHNDTSAGALFARGPAVAADGGRQKSETEVESQEETMRDVDHTPPHGEDGAKRVFERGDEYGVEEE